ncbi:hypothetical protein AB0L22_08860 [Micromonospora haikouensis]|uniref:hypothetical protein n=1 Tax=Micromonospora haikouensis TaxID=686309 RepID=UPI0034282D18
MTETTARATINPSRIPGLVASTRGVRIDTEAGWSAVVAINADECDQLAASFTVMGARLREHPEIVEAWDKLPDLDTGAARHDSDPEAMVRADERDQLAEAGRLLAAPAETSEQWSAKFSMEDGEFVGLAADSRSEAEQHRDQGLAAASYHLSAVLVRREVRRWPDGSVFFGPWTLAEETP